MRLRKDLIIPPKYRSEYAADRKVTWLELFYDLVFVVIVAQLANHLYASFTWPGVGGFVLLAVPCWWGWVGQTFYLSRFDSNDLVHQLLTMVKMFFVAIMALAIPAAFSGTGAQFAIAYACIRLILIYEYFRAGKHNPATRPLTTRYVIGFLIAAILWLTSTLFTGPVQIVLWVLAVVIDVATPSTAGIWNVWIPPHLKHLPERMGLFTIIVLGESILGIILGLDSAKLQLIPTICGIAGWIMVFCMWFVYFIGVEGAETRAMDEEHAGRSFRIWFYGHLPLMIGIILNAMAVKATFKKPLDVLPLVPAVCLCVGSGLVMIMMRVIFETNPTYNPSEEKSRRVRHHSLLNWIPFLLLPASQVLPAIALVWTVMAVWVAHVVLSQRDKPDLEEESGCSLG